MYSSGAEEEKMFSIFQIFVSFQFSVEVVKCETCMTLPENMPIPTTMNRSGDNFQFSICQKFHRDFPFSLSRDALRYEFCMLSISFEMLAAFIDSLSISSYC